MTLEPYHKAGGESFMKSLRSGTSQIHREMAFGSGAKLPTRHGKLEKGRDVFGPAAVDHDRGNVRSICLGGWYQPFQSSSDTRMGMQ